MNEPLNSPRQSGPPWERALAFAFGVLFVITLLALAVWFPNPSSFQYLVFRITLALAAAGVGALIPGILEVKDKDALRAGGALGVFIVVYFFGPAPLVVNRQSALGSAQVEKSAPAQAQPRALPQRVSCPWWQELQFVNDMNYPTLKQKFPDIYAQPMSGDEKIERLAKHGYYYAREGGGGKEWKFDIRDWHVPPDGRIDSPVTIEPVTLDHFVLRTEGDPQGGDARYITIRAYSKDRGNTANVRVEFRFSTAGSCPPVPH